MSGRYVALEGIEGAGKSTVARLVAARLQAQGHDVLAVREPGGTEAGELIRHILLDPGGSLSPWAEALLFAAARAQLAREIVGPALAEGRWVVTDRSVYSSLAYQGGGRELGVDTVRALNTPGLEGVWPDLVIVLDVPPLVGLDRQEVADRIGAEGIEFQRRVAGAFAKLAVEDPDRFLTVDAARPLAEVVASVMDALEDRW